VLIIVLTESPMEDPSPGTFFQINGLEPKTLGRGSNASLRIKHSSISREHIRFVPDTHTWFIEDLGSRNGTLLNDEPLKGKKLLAKGFRLKVGLFHFKVCSASRPTAEKKASQAIKKSSEPIAVSIEPIAVPQAVVAKSEPVKTKPPAWFDEDLIRHPDDHEPAIPEYGGGSEQDNLGTGIFPSMDGGGGDWTVIAEADGPQQYVADSYEPADDWDEPFAEDRPPKARATPRKSSSKKRPPQASTEPDWPVDLPADANDSKDGPRKPRRPIQTPKISRDKITDADLTALENFADMSSLNLSGSQITDVGLKYLKKLKHLRSLDLEGTCVTDQGIEHLAEMSHLTFLDLTDTRVSDQGIETLLKSLTLCRVVY
jgi:hypothetical protein